MLNSIQTRKIKVLFQKLTGNLGITNYCLYPYLNITEAKPIQGGEKKLTLAFNSFWQSASLAFNLPSHPFPFLFSSVSLPLLLKAVTPTVNIPVFGACPNRCYLVITTSSCFTNQPFTAFCFCMHPIRTTTKVICVFHIIFYLFFFF